MARACWLVPLGFLLFMFFPSACPYCVLLRPFVSLLFFHVLPLILPLYFMSSSLSFVFLLVCLLTHVRLLLRRDGCCCYDWCMLTVKKGSEGWCLRGLSMRGRLWISMNKCCETHHNSPFCHTSIVGLESHDRLSWKVYHTKLHLENDPPKKMIVGSDFGP